jgi:putative oxidoreductase
MTESLGDLRLLQILCAVWFLPHVAGKILHYDKAKGTFEAAGFRPGGIFLTLTVCMETAAMLGLLLGIQVGAASVLAAIVLLGAAYSVVRINGWNWRWQRMGPEFPVFWAAVCLLAGLGGVA